MEGSVITTDETMKRKANEIDSKASTKGPAWVDEDDEEIRIDLANSSKRARKLAKSASDTVIDGKEYEQLLRSQFRKLHGEQSWAKKRKIGNDEKQTETTPIVRTDAMLSSSSELRPHRIDVERLPSPMEKHDSNVTTTMFHPDHSMLVTTGLDRRVRIFDANPCAASKRPALLQSVVLSDMPVRSAAYRGGNEIITTGRRPFFYTYDLTAQRVLKIPRIATPQKPKSLETFAVSPDGKHIAFCGNDGYVIVCDGRTKKWVCDLKLNGSVRALSFTPNSEELLTVSGDGEMYRWSMRAQRCIDRHVDEGSLEGTAIASSPSGRRYAIGSRSGVVNVYDARSAAEARPALGLTKVRPDKAIMNLTTAIDRITFSSDASIMCMSSTRIQDAMRLVHVPTLTTFANWPTGQTPLGFVMTTSFSANNGVLAIGNHKGNVLLYRLRHYASI